MSTLLVPAASDHFCPFCGFNFPGQSPDAQIVTDPTGAWRVPWEERATVGLFQGYWQTTKAVFFTPTQCFDRLAPETGRWWDPLSYAIISAFFGVSGIAFFYLSLFGTLGIASLAQSEWRPRALQGVGVGLIVLGVVLFLVILIVMNTLMRAFVWAGIEHLMLKLVGVSTRGFEATVRAACYSTAPALLGIVPLCGAQVFPFWEIVCRIFAYRGVHKTTSGKATAAVLLPLGLCLVGGITLYAFFIAAIIAASEVFKR